MTAKDLIINFAYLVFFLLLVGGSIIFFSRGGRFDTFTDFLRSAWPLVFILAAFAFKLRLTRQEQKRGDRTGVNMFTLMLSFNDKMRGEMIAFAIPVAILGIAALSETGVLITDLIQAAVGFGLVFLWQKYLWVRAR